MKDIWNKHEHMDHEVSIIARILEILDILFFQLSRILENWKYVFSIFCHPGSAGGGRAGGRLLGSGFPWLGLFLGHCVWHFRIAWKYRKHCFHVCFVCFCKKRRAPKNDAECTDVHAEISHMRPVQGPKLKLSKCCVQFVSIYVHVILIFVSCGMLSTLNTGMMY